MQARGISLAAQGMLDLPLSGLERGPVRPSTHRQQGRAASRVPPALAPSALGQSHPRPGPHPPGESAGATPPAPARHGPAMRRARVWCPPSLPARPGPPAAQAGPAAPAACLLPQLQLPMGGRDDTGAASVLLPLLRRPQRCRCSWRRCLGEGAGRCCPQLEAPVAPTRPTARRGMPARRQGACRPQLLAHEPRPPLCARTPLRAWGPAIHPRFNYLAVHGGKDRGAGKSEPAALLGSSKALWPLEGPETRHRVCLGSQG